MMYNIRIVSLIGVLGKLEGFPLQIACKSVTALIQYFFLAAFSWMLCEGVMLYTLLVVVFSKIKNKWWFFLLLGWGMYCVIQLTSQLRTHIHTHTHTHTH